MRIGQVGEISVVWARMSSSSSPGASLARAVLSDGPANYEASLKPAPNPNSSFSSGGNPLEALSTAGIRPAAASMSMNSLTAAGIASREEIFTTEDTEDTEGRRRE